MAPDITVRTAANRRRIAELYDAMPASRWGDASLCRGWTLRTLLGHVVMPLVISPTRLAVRAMRLGSVHRASTSYATQLGERPVPELVDLLRERAGQRVAAPGVGPMGQFVDCCIHLRDAARPLGAPTNAPLEDWLLALSWLPTRAASLGHVPGGLWRGLRWSATDGPWAYGDGALICGPAEALALAMTGRSVVLQELHGAGVPELRRRLAVESRGR